MTRPIRNLMGHRPRSPLRARLSSSCKRFLSVTNDRLLGGGGVIVSGVDSALRWALDSYWRESKSRISDYLRAHTHVETVVLVLGLLPLALLLYIMGAFVVVVEECVEVLARLRWWWSQPRRHLLKAEEIRKRRETRALGRDEVKALPKIRPRALTLRSDGISPAFEQQPGSRVQNRVRQRTVHQLQACSLWRFPFEVREVIFKYAVGGNHVHIVKGRGRWGSVYCPAKDPIDPAHRDFCVRRDDDGYYAKSAWPKDMKPLALLVSCRQIYSECIDFLYSHNTFSFDDPAWFYAWMRFLLPCRVRLITSLHLAPVFAHEENNTRKPQLFIQKQPSPTDVDHYQRYLEPAFKFLEPHPTRYRLLVTPKPRLNFTTNCDLLVGNFVPKFVYELNRLQTAMITLAWPEDPAIYAPTAVVHTSYWGREASLPPEEDRKFELKEMPWQSPTALLAFFIPFDVQCLHCVDYTIIRRTTRGCAEVSFLPLSLSTIPPENPMLPDVLMRYWTYHVFCGGWIEFQYHGRRKEWSVTQGAKRIPKEDADRHLASREGLERQYPALGNPHERLKGITATYVVGGSGPGRWSLSQWQGIGMIIDEPTRETYYRNVGWTRD